MAYAASYNNIRPTLNAFFVCAKNTKAVHVVYDKIDLKLLLAFDNCLLAQPIVWDDDTIKQR